MGILDGLETWIELRRGECDISPKPRKCDECGVLSVDVGIYAEDMSTGEMLQVCRLCGEGQGNGGQEEATPPRRSEC